MARASWGKQHSDSLKINGAAFIRRALECLTQCFLKRFELVDRHVPASVSKVMQKW
jgi:hypothetical protein